MKILIVDDERPARERLCDLIRDMGGHVLLEADSGLAALQVAQNENPDTVMLDIRMPGMDGLETALHLSRLPSPPAMIFTTAYEEHALAAFEANAVHYLLKPIRQTLLAEALERAAVLRRGRLTALRQEETPGRARKFLSAAGHTGIQLMPVDEIRCLKADQKYVCAVGADRELLIDEPLKALEREFADRFLRIHRNALVAREYIEELERNRSGTFLVRLRGVRNPLAISRRHLPAVRRALTD